ncbi:hypothetical protein K438DRAFT_1763184 [Mycena galopus ATCC 62051]|nr:hypothetical protein K438DRAFT_1763184 [Mycena galopus ATCC 62051]
MLLRSRTLVSVIKDKFKAVEEATSAIADIIARDVHQSQGPDTVKKIASLRLNLTVPRAFFRSTMKGLVGQRPSDMRMPGRGKGPKQCSALNAIGIFQEIHTDGHEKLGEKALQMGSGIGIDTYGMRDHVGKVLWLVVVPNSRLSDTIGHVFFGHGVEIWRYVTFDGGSELGWLAAFQTTLREVFAPDLSAEEWKPVVAVKSTSNIPIESTWSYDRKFNGRSMRDILEEGRIHLIPGDVVYRELFQWLWPKIVQIDLDEFVDYFNNKKTRKQRGRILPSGVAPMSYLTCPAIMDWKISQFLLLKRLLTSFEAYRWVSDEFDALASEGYIQLGCPKLEALSGWAIFNAMAPIQTMFCVANWCFLGVAPDLESKYEGFETIQKYCEHIYLP